MPPPDATYLEAVRLAWWEGQLRSPARLSRVPYLADDERWVRTNVTNVVAALSP